MTGFDASRRASAIVLLGIFVYLGAAVGTRWEPYTFLFRDGAFYAQTNRAIAEGLTLRQEAVQPKSWYDGSLPWYRNVDDAWSNLSIGARGEWYPKHSYLMPVAATPFYLVSGPAGLLLFNLIAMALGLFAGYRLAARAVGDLPAAVAVFAVATCPLVPYLAYSYSHDVFYGALVAGSAAALVGGRHAAAGVLMGLAIFAKATNAVLVLPLVLFLFRGDRRAFLRMAVGGAIPLAAYAAANWFMYGAPWILSYNRILVLKAGAPQIVSYSDAFDTPLLEGLVRFFSSSPEGELWQAAAMVVIAYVGLLPLAFRSWRLAAALGTAAAAFTVVFATYHYGGARFCMPLLMLAPVPGAALVNSGGTLLRGLADAWGAIRRSRWAGLAIGVLAGAHLVGFGTAWIVRGGTAHAGATMAAAVEHLEVRVDDTPCDYFNMARQKWECSGIDRDDALFTGTAMAGQCATSDSPTLRVPPAPGGRIRTVRWIPSNGGTRLALTFALEATARGGPVRFAVRVGDAPVYTGSATVPKKVERVEIPVSIGAGIPVTFRLEPGSKESALCLDAVVLE